MDVIVPMIVGAIVATLMLSMLSRSELSDARANARDCIADGGTFEHCVNKYLMGAKQ